MSQRPIHTRYYNSKGEVIRINCSRHVANAVLRVVYHMQMGTYPAWSAEVYSEETGTLYVVVKRGTSSMNTTYRDEMYKTGDNSKVVNIRGVG